MDFIRPHPASDSAAPVETPNTFERRAITHWDPLGQEIVPGQFDAFQASYQEKLEYYKAHPKQPLMIFSLIILMGFIGVIIFGSSVTSSDSIVYHLEDLGFWLFLGCFPAAWYYRWIQKLQRDLIKIMVAEKNGWIYSPEENQSRWMGLKQSYPEIFKKGHEDQTVQDEFWGSFEERGEDIPFWSCVFEYVVKKRGSKGRTKRVTYYQTVFALRLNKNIKVGFALLPESFGTRLGNFFHKKDIETESSAFNKAFYVSYIGDKSEQQLNIMQMLSPAVQDKLLQLRKEVGPFAILFRKDAVFVSLKGRMLKRMHTNFIRKVELNPEDESSIQKRLHRILDISGDIVPFLD